MKKSSKKLSPKIITLHEQFSRYGRNAREWMRKCVLLLPEIERNRVWEKKGFFSIYEYAIKLAGMSRETVNEGLRILKKIEDKPELLKVVKEKGYLAIKPVATIATAETAKFWAEKAKIMSVHTLETYVKEIRKQENNQSEINNQESQNGLFMPKIEDIGRHVAAEKADFPQKKAILIFVEPQIAEQLEKLKAKNDWNTLMKEFLKLREEKLNTELKEIERKEIKKIIKKKNKMVAAVEQNEDGEIGGAILNEGTRTTKTVINKNELYKAKNHQPSTKTKKYVLHKTNNTCAFPGCTKPAENLHHTERFSIMGRHNPEKIIPLCKEHHELVHDGLIENEEDPVEKWKILCEYPHKALRESNERELDKTDLKFFVDQQVLAYRRQSN
jgi:hypothetical protein